MSHCSVRPCRIEQLEHRRLLAVTLDLDGGGRLRGVSTDDLGQTANITLTVRPDNRITVTEGTTDYGTFDVAKNLEIDLGDTAGVFVNRLDLNNNTLDANVRVRLGDAAILNQFRITTPGGGTGTLDGNLTVNGGDGADFITFGELGGQTVGRTINVTGNVKIDTGGGGADPNVPDGPPPDSVATGGFDLGSSDPQTGTVNTILNVGKNMTVENSTVLALRGSVAGNLRSDSSEKDVGQLVILGNFGLPFSVGKNVKIVTGNDDDRVDVQGAQIAGHFSLATNGGDDLIFVTNDLDVTDSVPTRVGKHVTINTGSGDDELEVTALVAPKGHVRVTLGGGADSFSFADGADVDVDRLLIDFGAGTDAYDPGAGNSFGFPVMLVGLP